MMTVLKLEMPLSIRKRQVRTLAALFLVGFGLSYMGAVARAHASAMGTAVLVYHRFASDVAGPTTVTIPAFETQLAWLSRHGYRIIPLHEAVTELNGIAPGLRGPSAAITIDDGHESVYTILFPLIRKMRVPVTLFIYPSAISNASYALTWAQLEEMEASGLVDIESHTYWHPNFKTERRRLSSADYQTFVDIQLARSKAILEKRLGKPVDQMAWPFGIVDPDLEAAARRAGYMTAFAYTGGPAQPGDDQLALPRIPVTDADRGRRFEELVIARDREKQKP